MKHLLQVLAVVALLFGCYTAKAQMSYGGEPYSFKGTLSQSVPTIEVEALDAEALLAEDAAIFDQRWEISLPFRLLLVTLSPKCE